MAGVDHFEGYPWPPDKEVERYPSRPPIVRGEWEITIQLRVETGKDSGVMEKRGDPLVLHFSDSYLAGAKSATKEKKGGAGVPEDFGSIMTRALYERAQRLRKVRK